MCLPLPSLLTRRRREKVYYPVPPEPYANAVSSWTYVPPSRPYTPPATIRPPTPKPSKAIYFTPDGKYTDETWERIERERAAGTLKPARPVVFPENRHNTHWSGGGGGDFGGSSSDGDGGSGGNGGGGGGGGCGGCGGCGGQIRERMLGTEDDNSSA